MAKKVFTVSPKVPLFDEKGAPRLDGDNKPLTKPIGDFVFRFPTIGDRLTIGVRRATLLQGQANVDEVADTIAVISATLPYMAEKVPDGWDWSALMFPDDFDSLRAVYDEYAAEVGRFRG